MRCAIRDWGESSSCHGIPHMAQASTFCAAIVWSIILAFCAVGFVYFFTSTLSQYLRFDKIVQLNVSFSAFEITGFRRQMELDYVCIEGVVPVAFQELGLEAANFPSVTFCNINPYKKSKIQMVPALQALMTVYELSSNGTLT
ncbi:hypothetical protein ANCCAN_17747 [Ancylostoma caninum]|uniref:Amiloride-sensitive sodium channel n=1 Tax=Ancylostoma caninum TaxID=29170 RepID=A0A368G040_ANCCA|nr:hypothetical protein ANCCAN_17747 [Ancylostoma caninum]